MQKLISIIIEKCIASIFNAYEKEQLISDLTESRTFRGLELSGNSFQIAFLYNNLNEANLVIKDNRITEILSFLLPIIESNYELYGFNYFNKIAIPDDLDTASSVTRAIKKEHVIHDFYKRVKKNTNSDGLINTWFLSDSIYNAELFHATSIYQNKEFYHADVLLNYYHTIHELEPQTDLWERICTTIKQTGLANYWYIPILHSMSSYTILASKLLPKEKNTIAWRRYYDLIDKFKKDAPAHCKLEKIREIVFEENNKDNYINDVHYLVCEFIQNKNFVLSQKEDHIKHIQEGIDTSLPALFWSVGLEPYKSYIINFSIVLQSISLLYEQE